MYLEGTQKNAEHVHGVQINWLKNGGRRTWTTFLVLQESSRSTFLYLKNEKTALGVDFLYFKNEKKTLSEYNFDLKNENTFSEYIFLHFF